MLVIDGYLSFFKGYFSCLMIIIHVLVTYGKYKKPLISNGADEWWFMVADVEAAWSDPPLMEVLN